MAPAVAAGAWRSESAGSSYHGLLSIPLEDLPLFRGQPAASTGARRTRPQADDEDVALRLAEQLEQSRRRELAAKEEIVRLRGSLARAEEAAKQALCLSEPSAGGALARRTVRAEQAADGAIGAARAAERETTRLRARNGELRACLNRSQERLDAALADQRSLARRLGDLEAALGGPAAAQRRLAQIGRERAQASHAHDHVVHSSGARTSHGTSADAGSRGGGALACRSDPTDATQGGPYGGRSDARSVNAPRCEPDAVGVRVVFLDGSGAEGGAGERESGGTGESATGGRSRRSGADATKRSAASGEDSAKHSEQSTKPEQTADVTAPKSRVKSVRYDDRVLDGDEAGGNDDDFAIPAGKHPAGPPTTSRRSARSVPAAEALFDVRFSRLDAAPPPARKGALKKGAPGRAKDRFASLLSSLTETARSGRADAAIEFGELKTARGESRASLGLATARGASLGLGTIRAELRGPRSGLKTARGTAASPGLALKAGRGAGSPSIALKTSRGRPGELTLKTARGSGVGSRTARGYGTSPKTARGASQSARGVGAGTARSSAIAERSRALAKADADGSPGAEEDPDASPPLYSDIPLTLRPAALDALKRIHADAKRAKAQRRRPERTSTSPAGLAEPWTALLLAPAGLSAVANAAGRNADDSIMRERKALKAWKLVCVNAHPEDASILVAILSLVRGSEQDIAAVVRAACEAATKGVVSEAVAAAVRPAVPATPEARARLCRSIDRMRWLGLIRWILRESAVVRVHMIAELFAVARVRSGLGESSSAEAILRALDRALDGSGEEDAEEEEKSEESGGERTARVDGGAHADGVAAAEGNAEEAPVAPSADRTPSITPSKRSSKTTYGGNASSRSQTQQASQEHSLPRSGGAQIASTSAPETNSQGSAPAAEPPAAATPPSSLPGSSTDAPSRRRSRVTETPKGSSPETGTHDRSSQDRTGTTVGSASGSPLEGTGSGTKRTSPKSNPKSCTKKSSRTSSKRAPASGSTPQGATPDGSAPPSSVPGHSAPQGSAPPESTPHDSRTPETLTAPTGERTTNPSSVPRSDRDPTGPSQPLNQGPALSPPASQRRHRDHRHRHHRRDDGVQREAARGAAETSDGDPAPRWPPDQTSRCDDSSERSGKDGAELESPANGSEKRSKHRSSHPDSALRRGSTNDRSSPNGRTPADGPSDGDGAERRRSTQTRPSPPVAIGRTSTSSIASGAARLRRALAARAQALREVSSSFGASWTSYGGQAADPADRAPDSPMSVVGSSA